MSSAPSQSLNALHVSDKLIVWAVLSSFVMHVAFAWLIPSLSLEKEDKKEPLKVQIIHKPTPVVAPKPIKPPTKPKPKPKPKKKIKPKKVVKPKALPKPAPVPLPTIVPVAIPEPEPLPEYVPPPVAPVEPTPEPPPPEPTPVVQEPVISPPPPSGPSPSEINAAKAAYISTLQAEMRKHKKYPRIAKSRGWQGKVIIEFNLDNQGNITKTSVIESSGHDTLDKQAIKMAKKAAPFPAPPLLLRGKSFSVRVPVPFKLRAR